MDALLLRLADVGELLSLGQTKVKELIRSGAIESVHIGRTVRVPRSALEAYLATLPTTAAPAPDPGPPLPFDPVLPPLESRLR